MGILVYPVIENQTADWAKFRTASKPLAKVVMDLEKIAKRNDVEPLYDFFSMSREQSIAEILGGDPDDPSSYDKSRVPEEKWFDPGPGIKTVTLYTSYVNGHRSEFAEPDSVLEDLREFERILSQAKALGLRWHLGQSC